MTDDVPALREKAARFLNSARLLAQTDPESSVSRAYYAMFTLARALLVQGGEDPKTHRGVHVLFSDLYVRGGTVPEALGADFRLAWRHREEADYAGTPGLTPEDAARTLERAERFAAHLGGLFRRL